MFLHHGNARIYYLQRTVFRPVKIQVITLGQHDIRNKINYKENRKKQITHKSQGALSHTRIITHAFTHNKRDIRKLRKEPPDRGYYHNLIGIMGYHIEKILYRRTFSMYHQYAYPYKSHRKNPYENTEDKTRQQFYHNTVDLYLLYKSHKSKTDEYIQDNERRQLRVVTQKLFASDPFKNAY